MYASGIEHIQRNLWPVGELPMERWARFRGDDLIAVHEHMVSAFCPHELITQGGNPPLSFRHNQLDLQTCTLNATDYGLPFGQVALYVPPANNSFLVQFVLEGRALFRHQDHEFALEPGYMAVFSPNAATRQVTEAGCKHFTLKLDRLQLENLLHEDIGRHGSPLVFEPDPVELVGPAASFAQLMRSILLEVDSGMAAYIHPRSMRTTEQMLGRLLLSTVPHNHSFDYEHIASSGMAPYYVRRAEQFIRAHYRDQITLPDLISASGVSGRSLHAGFRRYRDETPMGYLKRYRLEQARRALVGGHAATDTITGIALANGFSHPGKFSQDYVQRYGETPSATLRNSGSMR